MAEVAGDQVLGLGRDGAFEEAVVVFIGGGFYGRGGIYVKGRPFEVAKHFLSAVTQVRKLWTQQNVAIFGGSRCGKAWG